jgi:hypothetical protein
VSTPRTSPVATDTRNVEISSTRFFIFAAPNRSRDATIGQRSVLHLEAL